MTIKNSLRVIIIAVMLILATVFVTSCGEDDNPYGSYDEAGHKVSVRYDANGGFFTTNTDIIVDTYNIDSLKVNANGKKEIGLISPSDERRGSGNVFTPINSGYFLAGWYTSKTPVLDAGGNALDSDGNLASESGKAPAYKYSGRWDFENDLYEIDPNNEYSADTPVVTLYAAWIKFGVEFYSLETGEKYGEYYFDPNFGTELKLPSWNRETGTIDMYKFPQVNGKTFEAVYLDSKGENKVEGDTLNHTGSYDAETAETNEPIMKLYVDMKDGNWYRIYTAEQFIKNSSVSGNYEIMADLDFTDLTWKSSLIHGRFTGKIIGNGHTLSNISVEQTNMQKNNTGLFGIIADEASVTGISFKNVTLTLKRGTTVNGSNFGLLAGTVASGAEVNGISFEDCKLLIDSSAYFPADYSIGLVCGYGEVEGANLDGIACEATGDDAQKVTITVDGNEVKVEVTL